MKKTFKHVRNAKKLLLFVIIFAVVSSLILLATHAASPSVRFEPEDGSITNPAISGTNPSASGGGFVQFGGTNRSRLGVDINDLPPGITTAHAYDVMAFLGFGIVRTGPSFSTYRDNTNLDSGFDNEISLAKARNLKIMAVLTYAYSDCSGGHCAPSNPAAWAQHAGLLVAHWKATNPGVVTSVEVWNEANNDQFWNPVDPSKYADLLKRTYTEVKAADSSMVVVASGPAPGGGNTSADAPGTATSIPRNPATWYKQIYASGAKGSFDAAANHPYDTRNLTANTTLSGLRNTFWIRKVMNNNGEQAKQIWSTEAGLVSCLDGPGSNTPMTEAQRGQRLKDDLNDFWHGVHDPNDGHTIGQAATDDWNAGPYFLFKLYKSTTGDPGLGLIYNTNPVMQFTAQSVADSEPLCESSPDFFVPNASANGNTDYMGRVLSKFSGAQRSQIVN